MFFFIDEKIPNNKNKFTLNYYSVLYIFFLSFNIITTKTITNVQSSKQICSITTYDNTSVTEECLDGPKKDTRVLEYKTFEDYILDNSFKHNGLAFYSSLFVDTDYHNFGDFMDGGMVIIILFIIALILLIAWIPLICCWKHEVCLFDECCIENQCCFILWNIINYILLAAVLAFIIVSIIFAE